MIVDLSKVLRDGMEVYPGDPEVKIKQVHRLKKDGWRLRRLEMSTHTGTHVDSFSHMDDEGQAIDQMQISKFIAKTRLVRVDQAFPKRLGLAFRVGKLGVGMYEKIEKSEPLLVAVGSDVEMEVELERKLLNAGILTVTNLINMEELPEDKLFTLFAVPLKIKNGDGSPVRAFAVLEDEN